MSNDDWRYDDAYYVTGDEDGITATFETKGAVQ